MGIQILIFMIIIFTVVTIIISAVVNSGKVYACPSCGHLFSKKWYKILLASSITNNTDGIRIKCPACKKVDLCHPTRR